MPLNDGWKKVITKVKSSGPREDVFNALQELGLTLPVTQEAIKKAYRENVIKWHPDRNLNVDSTQKMQIINKAFELLTGIDPNSLAINERIIFDYRKRPDYVSTDEGIIFSITLQMGTPNDWIYASGFSIDQKHVYLGSYAGKVVRINSYGMPIKVYDISNIPRQIIDTGDYLYIQADTRLYILANGETLIDLVDMWNKEKFIVGDNSFGFLGNKHLRWFDETGNYIGTVTTKHPIRAIYTLEKDIVVETRQHRAVLSYT